MKMRVVFVHESTVASPNCLPAGHPETLTESSYLTPRTVLLRIATRVAVSDE
jgi:hypothetical protein